jgi:hypothetical protein
MIVGVYASRSRTGAAFACHHPRSTCSPRHLEHVTVADPMTELPPLAEVLNTIPDPRSRRGRRYRPAAGVIAARRARRSDITGEDHPFHRRIRLRPARPSRSARYTTTGRQRSGTVPRPPGRRCLRHRHLRLPGRPRRRCTAHRPDSPPSGRTQLDRHGRRRQDPARQPYHRHPRPPARGPGHRRQPLRQRRPACHS